MPFVENCWILMTQSEKDPIFLSRELLGEIFHELGIDREGGFRRFVLQPNESLKTMTILIPARRSISFIVISVGGIVLSAVIASLFVSYKPAGVNFSINWHSIGTGSSKQPSLDSVDGNRTEASIKLPEISEQGRATVKDDQFSSVAEVPAFAPTPSVDELQRINNDNSSVGVTGSYSKEPDLPASSVFDYDSGKNSSGVDSYSVAAVPAIAPALSVVDEMPPTLWVDELQNVENANNSVSASGSDSKEPDVSVPSVLKNGHGIGSHGIALNQTAPVATIPSPPSKDYEKSKLKSCDLYHGKWIYDSAGPLYTNITCPILAQAQNCQGNGRPDKNYENWRWKPNQCKIPRFDGRKFLELMRGRTLAFVGDSLARNQMESLLCILWQTEVPTNHGSRQIHKWHFQSTSTTIVRIWSAWLVRKTDLPIPSASPRAVKVHVDTPDEGFMQFLPKFDVLVLSTGHWFTMEATYVHNGTTVGRQLRHTKRSRKKIFDIIKFYSMAVQTTLNAIVNIPNYTGLTIFRSYSPEHYEGGAWNTGGSCAGVDSPASKSLRSAYAKAMWRQQVAEVVRASRKMKNGSKLRFMDITEMTGYRHDGHAGSYSRQEHKKNRPEDCVHWCMPGTADTWNEVLFEILKREM